MPKHRRSAPKHSRVISLLILEGETEEIFYPIIRDKFLKGVPVKLRSIKGRGNVNKDVLSEIYKYVYNNRNDLIRAYCCLDTERQKHSATPFELPFVREQAIANVKRMQRVLSIDAILADPEIESWFFYDIDGIYRFLQDQKSQRNPGRYQNPKNLGKRDLQRLFRKFGKLYTPGRKAQNFINNLNMGSIINGCIELYDGVDLILSQAADLTNHLFSRR